MVGTPVVGISVAGIPVAASPWLAVGASYVAEYGGGASIGYGTAP